MKVKNIYKLDDNCENQCPKCRDKKSFIRYIDTRTHRPLDKKVGKCIYESKCGYHLYPEEFIQNLLKSRVDDVPY